MVSPILTSPEAVDTLTYAQPQVARVTHVALDLALDFDSKRVGGTAELTVLAAPGAQEIVLDSNGLEIEQVTDGSGRALAYWCHHLPMYQQGVRAIGVSILHAF